MISNRHRFNIWLPKDRYDQLADLAEKRCVSVAALARALLVGAIDAEKPVTKQIKTSQKLDAPPPVANEEDEIDYSEWE